MKSKSIFHETAFVKLFEKIANTTRSTIFGGRVLLFRVGGTIALANQIWHMYVVWVQGLYLVISYFANWYQVSLGYPMQERGNYERLNQKVFQTVFTTRITQETIDVVNELIISWRKSPISLSKVPPGHISQYPIMGTAFQWKFQRIIFKQ